MEENTSKAYVGADPPLTTMTPGAGSALFVINLCASIAPVDASGRNLPGLENYRLYQVARVEDGRTRHRLRLGFFTSESHAESVLTVVRQQYPTAFTTCLCDEDRRFVRGYLPHGAGAPATSPKRPVAVAPAPAPAKVAAPPSTSKATAPRPAATAPMKPAAAASAALPAPAPRPTPAASAKPAASANPSPADGVAMDDFTWEPPALPAQNDTASTARHPVLSAVHKTQPVLKAAPPKATPPAQTPAQVDAAASVRIKALDLTFSDPPAPAAQKAAAPSNEPFHVGKGVNIGDLAISLQPEPLAAQPSAPKPSARTASPPPAKSQPPAGAPAAAAKPVPKAAAPTKPAMTPKAPGAKTAPPLPKAAAAALTGGGLPDLDSTQTIRALTSAELNDDAQEKWFAIQLAASEQPVNLDTMPHLDIFEAYRLYSVATAGSGKIIHSLRLGFFKEAVSAEAVSGYLKTFFSTPSVLRISVAEHARFKDPPALNPRADEARAAAKVFELSDARASRPIVPTVTMEVPTPRADATGSFKVGDAFRPNATGSFSTSTSGAHKVLTPTLKPAAKSAVATKRASSQKAGGTGRYKALNKKSLQEQLLDEAREVELSESGIRKLPKNGSLLSKLVGKLTK